MSWLRDINIWLTERRILAMEQLVKEYHQDAVELAHRAYYMDQHETPMRWAQTFNASRRKQALQKASEQELNRLRERLKELQKCSSLAQ